jgi:hypothetical protein
MSKSQIKAAAKFAAKFVVASGVTKIVHDVVESNVTAETTFEKVQVWAGSAVLSIYASDKAWDHMEEKVNELQQTAASMKDEDPKINVTVVQ